MIFEKIGLNVKPKVQFKSNNESNTNEFDVKKQNYGCKKEVKIAKRRKNLCIKNNEF